MAVVLCDDSSKPIFTTGRTPAEITCPVRQDAGDRGSSLVKLADGSVEVSSFPMGTANGRPVTALIVHDLSFIDRRQSSARNYVLAVAGVAASVLALFLGFVFWLLIRRWVNELVGDIRGRRFLDDAHSEPGSRPLLTQIRRVLREVESTQRLEIDFHENWTPQALQQVVRDHLGSPEVFIVSNREPYIHNAGPNGPVVQVPASGMVTALEPIMRACSGTWVAHGSGNADRQVVDSRDRVRVPPEDPSYSLRRVWLSAEEEQGFYYGFANEGMWPLCHLAYVRPAFREADWQQYQAVNQ
jgi:trehalose 6-phosphate synthase